MTVSDLSAILALCPPHLTVKIYPLGTTYRADIQRTYMAAGGAFVLVADEPPEMPSGELEGQMRLF